HVITSDQFQYSSGAKWTPDGKKLLFAGGISAPAMASQGFRGSPAQLYSFALTHADKAPDSRDINTEEQALAQMNDQPQGPPGGAGRRGGANAAPVNVNIE